MDDVYERWLASIPKYPSEIDKRFSWPNGHLPSVKKLCRQMHLRNNFLIEHWKKTGKKWCCSYVR